MTRFWIMAPVESKPQELFEKVWQFDLANNLISIGWSELGDVSSMSREELADAVSSTYPDKPAHTKSLIINMLWSFFHEIKPGDSVIARRGRKILAGVGKVLHTASYAPKKNPHLASQQYVHSSFLEVDWQPQPRDKVFPMIVFPMHTITETSEAKFHSLVEGGGTSDVPLGADETIEDRQEFVLEKYLEDFIVSNFERIFGGKLEIYEDSDGNEGQQFDTKVGLIDILAVEAKSRAFVVIELKKGRPSDQVVGQVLRYMGWVKANLCKDGQVVKGLIICRDHDPKLSYALEMTRNVDVRYYSVSFKLKDAP